MPDIAMCKGIDCNVSHRCYRYTAEPWGPNGEWQTYMVQEEHHKGESCNMFKLDWRTKDDKKA